MEAGTRVVELDFRPYRRSQKYGLDVGSGNKTRNLRIDGPGNAPYNRGFRFVSGGAMYAVIRSGSKQYRVAQGEITFGDVLAVGTDEKKLLTGPDAAKAKVVGKITAQGRHPKIKVLKFKTTNQFKICTGHRQNYTAVEVTGIEL
jgi:large subunit ribosomal protein L21